MPEESSKRRVFVAALTVLIVSPLVCGQKRVPLTRFEAIRKARVGAIPNWRETISDKGRFRILFPGPAQVDNNVVSAVGLRVIEPNTSWNVFYSDLDRIVPINEAAFRKAYRAGLNGMTGEGRTLLSQRDVYLNGGLGTEFVIDGVGRTSYMRVFVVGRRLYTLAAHRNAVDASNRSNIPTDVRQFFDSFAYWE
ncbi:MAG TPA: hypothetical protein VFX97_15540 [Pyrinomonadaceae bacterium]|nr:hypothetical protein [Pyrinomonadaceae bacterium]